jgi:hypothetical protein
MGLSEDLAFALLMAGGLTVVSCVGGSSGGGIAGRRSQSPQADGLVIDLGVSLGVVRHLRYVIPVCLEEDFADGGVVIGQFDGAWSLSPLLSSELPLRAST